MQQADSGRQSTRSIVQLFEAAFCGRFGGAEKGHVIIRGAAAAANGDGFDTMLSMTKPEKSEYDPYYEKYVSLVPDADVVAVLASQPTELQDIFVALPEEKGTYAYAEGKWSLKEVISHLIDGERIFAYRALRISRGDETPIEGFEQDGYIENSHANDRSFGDLLEEFNLLRRANLLLFHNLRDDGWSRLGTASGAGVSVRALAHIMAGHVLHHVNVLRGRYLV